jgi:hypothetical protein
MKLVLFLLYSSTVLAASLIKSLDSVISSFDSFSIHFIVTNEEDSVSSVELLQKNNFGEDKFVAKIDNLENGGHKWNVGDLEDGTYLLILYSKGKSKIATSDNFVVLNLGDFTSKRLFCNVNIKNGYINGIPEETHMLEIRFLTNLVNPLYTMALSGFPIKVPEDAYFIEIYDIFEDKELLYRTKVEGQEHDASKSLDRKLGTFIQLESLDRRGDPVVKNVRMIPVDKKGEVQNIALGLFKKSDNGVEELVYSLFYEDLEWAKSSARRYEKITKLFIGTLDEGTHIVKLLYLNSIVPLVLATSEPFLVKDDLIYNIDLSESLSGPDILYKYCHLGYMKVTLSSTDDTFLRSGDVTTFEMKPNSDYIYYASQSAIVLYQKGYKKNKKLSFVEFDSLTKLGGNDENSYKFLIFLGSLEKGNYVINLEEHRDGKLESIFKTADFSVVKEGLFRASLMEVFNGSEK